MLAACLFGIASWAQDVISIGTAEELATFAERVNSGENGVNAKLTADIDFTMYPETEIGLPKLSYEGTFDGQGHTITLGIVRNAVQYAALFRNVGSKGIIKNLITDGTITTNNQYASGLVGVLYGRLESCASFVTINSSIEGDGTHGGLAAFAYKGSSIGFCLSAVKIVSETTSCCGGVVGWLWGTCTLNNNLCIAELNLTNLDSGGYYSDTYCRASDQMSSSSGNNYYLNFYSAANANYCTQVTKEQLASGEICCLLNGDQSDIRWYQTIGVDDYPMPFADREVVYIVNKTYGNASSADDFAAFRAEVLANEQEYCDTVAAQQTLVEAYADALPALKQCGDIETLIGTYNNDLKPLYDAVAKSEKAYSVYVNKVNETIAYLEANPNLDNEKVDELKSYLTEAEEPSDLFPNGTTPYILENGLLNEEEILTETERIEPMLLEAILYSPTAGTNVTKLLTNPDFADDFNGWEGRKGTGNGGSSDNTMRAGECWNNTMDMYQTLTDLQDGIYELQVNGAFRPYPSDDRYSTNYAAMLYANGMNNFFQANIEDMILAADAADGVNCHITGTNPDLAVTDIDGNVIGYTMNGVIGCCNAFSVGRYKNSVLVNVADGTLTVGIKQPGTGNSNDWLGFGNIQLIYHGTIEEATAGLDNTLACMTARANTLINVYVPSAAEDYQLYPNFPQALKDQLAATMEAAEAATDNAEKYKLIETFSDLFLQVYEGKMAYINLMKQATKLADWMSELSPSLTEDELSGLTELSGYLSASYTEGTFSTEEALKDYLDSLPFVPKPVDGVYQIGTAAQLKVFCDIVNGGNNAINAVLTADIDFTMYPESEIGLPKLSYEGTFDGQGHTITLDIVRNGVQYAALFRNVGSKGVIKNLITDGTINTDNQYASGIAGQLYGRLESCASFVTINSSVEGDGTHGGLAAFVYKGSSIAFCLAAVKIVSETTSCCGGVVGWLWGTCTLNDNLCIAELNLTNLDTGGYYSDTFCRASDQMSSSSGNNYYLNFYSDVNANYCTQVTNEQLASGEVCYQLNGDQSNIQWYQSIGEDAYPMPFAKQGGTVGKDENGLFINTAIQKIAANKLMRDGIYNLLGQKLQKTAKGVNIVDGKKILVK